jgi:hypothetical protein
MSVLTTVKITTFFETDRTGGVYAESPETVYDDSEFRQPLPKDYPTPAGGIHTSPTNVQIKSYLSSKGLNIIKPSSMKKPEFDKFVKGTKQPFGLSYTYNKPNPKMFFDGETYEKPGDHYDYTGKKIQLRDSAGSNKWDWLRRSVYEFSMGEKYESFGNISVEYGHNKEQLSWPNRLPKDHDYQIITYSFLATNDYSEEHSDRIEYIQEVDQLSDKMNFHFYDKKRADKNFDPSKKSFETKHNWQTAHMLIDSWEVSTQIVKPTKTVVTPTKTVVTPTKTKKKPTKTEYTCGKLQVRKVSGLCPDDKRYSDREKKPDCCYKTRLASKIAKSKPTVSKPTVVSKPTLSKPTVSKPTLSKPTVSKPTVSKPTVSKSVPEIISSNLSSSTANMAISNIYGGDHVIVFTGFRDKGLEAHIVDMGGIVNTAISKKTTILIYKTNVKSQTKLNKAREKGLIIIELEKFKKGSFYKSKK